MGIPMKKYGLGLLGLTLTSVVAIASANAADMYVPGPVGPGGYKDAPWAPTWAGFYVGANGGYGWSNTNRNITLTDTVTSAFDIFKGADPAGGFGGGQIGYNFQRDHFVFGVEVDLQGSGIGDSVTTSPTRFPGAIGSVTSDLDWFGTVRGRLGYAFDRALIYGTGGFAFGGIHDRVHYDNGVGNNATFNNDNTQTGYVVGGGVEYKIAPAWSVKAEYQYINLGNDQLTSTFVNVPKDGAKLTEIDHTYNTVRVGLNYHIHDEYVPLK
jgi:outer membrane immunogenic protein